MAAKATNRKSTSPVEKVYPGAVPVPENGMVVTIPAPDAADADSIVVVDALVVSDGVVVVVVVAVTNGTEPVSAVLAAVAFAEIGPALATEDRKANASESADTAAADA